MRIPACTERFNNDELQKRANSMHPAKYELLSMLRPPVTRPSSSPRASSGHRHSFRASIAPHPRRTGRPLPRPLRGTRDRGAAALFILLSLVQEARRAAQVDRLVGLGGLAAGRGPLSLAGRLGLRGERRRVGGVVFALSVVGLCAAFRLDRVWLVRSPVRFGVLVHPGHAGLRVPLGVLDAVLDPGRLDVVERGVPEVRG
jgi:hypothetical protein